MTEPVQADFARHMVELHGAQGAAWLAELPARLEACSRRWSLQVQPPFADLTYNYVAPAFTADGREVVLKLGVPTLELRTEIAALRHYDGHGIACLLDADAEEGVLLLERLQPGSMLAEVEDDAQAMAIAAGVMLALWKPLPPDHRFPTAAMWAADLQKLRATFAGGTGPFPARLVEMAERLFAELVASQGEQVLLHGDLHHYNILRAQRAPWLALDPKGVAGEREYEVGALLRNPFGLLDWPDLAGVTARRIEQLAELLGFDRQRLAAWGMAQEMLSLWWTYEDHGEYAPEDLALAEVLAKLADARR
jgi:streptomycin 6-kinase